MKWISVKDRLPKTDNKVLVYPYSGLLGHYLRHTSRKWISIDGDDIVVTHWMLRPEAPEEAE